MAARYSSMFFVLLIACFVLSETVFATPYRTPEQIAEEFQQSGVANDPPFVLSKDRREQSALDEIAYFAHYRMLCDFLVSRQYMQQNENLGGMIEGESGADAGIIQTDNTQEAIRIWSRYAIWTGDTASYGPNIRLAWGYCENWPAWEEEGGGYYAMHNCGWGLEAERLYRTAYGDTSWLWYADDCAEWVVANPLPYNPNSTDLGQVNPLAEGLGIGGLYPHAVFRGQQTWINACLNEGRRLRTWFQSNPARLNNNEVWALCGGTALWGLCETLFAAYPDSGATWLAQYGPQLDIWQSTGQWNHAFNTWYCNAQHVTFRITQDSTYWNNAVFITDSLIGLDTDDDGGIPPGRGFPVTNDHSWVSAYMGWMGMERIIDSLPQTDAIAVGFVSPNPSLPYLAGDSLIVSAHVLNAGWLPALVTVNVSGLSYTQQIAVTLEAGADSIISLPQRWVLPDNGSLPPDPELYLAVSADGDELPANDSVTVPFDIRRGVDVAGLLTAACPSPDFTAQIEFYHEDYPDSIWTVSQGASGGTYTNGTRRLMAGENRIRVIPPVNLMVTEQAVELIPGTEPQTVNFTLPCTDVVLMDDDDGAAIEQYYESSMDSFALNTRHWDRTTDGICDITTIPTVIWFTGNDSVFTLSSLEQAQISEYLNQGGHLILSGQNITDELGNNSIFLTQVLQCSTRNPATGYRHIEGIAGDPISDGLELFILGPQGANNQTSPASIYTLGTTTEILRYFNSDETCGAAGTYGNGKFVFLSFGVEAISGITESTTREQFLSRCFAWLGDSISAAEDLPALPSSIAVLESYPNPFNPTTTIRFMAPPGANLVTIAVYNLLGQKVRELFSGRTDGTRMTLFWNGDDDRGISVSSGQYICRMQAGNRTVSRSLMLVR